MGRTINLLEIAGPTEKPEKPDKPKDPAKCQHKGCDEIATIRVISTQKIYCLKHYEIWFQCEGEKIGDWETINDKRFD